MILEFESETHAIQVHDTKTFLKEKYKEVGLFVSGITVCPLIIST